MQGIPNIKNNTFEIIDKAQEENRVGMIFNYAIILLIILNVIAIVLESFETVGFLYGNHLKIFEIFSVAVFTIEYILRIWTAELKYKGNNKYYASIKFIVSPMGIIDLFAIAPFYLPMLLPFDLRCLRMLRLTRLLRVLKLNRYFKALNLVGKVLKEKKEELTITVFITFILLLIASTLMYYIENNVQPDEFPNIISTFWWAIATLTTIGYGDVYPITSLGRVLSGLIAILGIGLVALPTGIISSGFMEELKKKNGQEKDENEEEDFSYCPHCGKRLKK